MRSFILLLSWFSLPVFGQLSQVWVADQGDGTYQNPILHADYSDPDVIRVGSDFYLVSSSFNSAPGLPILHSKDLVNWSIISHALPKLVPMDHFSIPKHGQGVWAPSLRFHQGLFYLFYPDPDFGIYMITATHPKGPWSKPHLVKAGKGLIDPCPLWDSDGKAYLTFALAGSRAGQKSILLVAEMSPDGQSLDENTVLVWDGHAEHPTVEGPKFYKREGHYYISAPAGGVSTGWQLILRAKNPFGPYESKVVLAQGPTSINGPHQGAWVDTPRGEWWFLHFQDKGLYGRIVHLQPMSWKNDWPQIGEDPDGDGVGQPVLRWKKPEVGSHYPRKTPAESDEFNEPKIGLQWQWPANPQLTFGFPTAQGYFFQSTHEMAKETTNLYDFPNILLQKFPAPTFQATMKVSVHPNPKLDTEQWGLMITGFRYAWLGMVHRKGKKYLVYQEALEAKAGKVPRETILGEWNHETVYWRVQVKEGGLCRFSYSHDNEIFHPVNEPIFQATEGQWVGAQLGFFAARSEKTNDAGYMKVDWFRVEKLD